MNMKRFNLRTIILALTLTALSLGTWQYLSKHTNEANLQRQLQSKQIELTNKLLELEKNKKSNKDYQKQVDKLKKDLQTKRAEQRKIAARTSAVVYAESAPEPVQQINASHASLMTAAGIPLSQQGAAEKLVHRESSWNPNAYNSIGACSLVQALPCSKIPGNWRDPVTALRWGHSYVVSRYGNWNVALAHSYNHNWY
jgi:hypothetical protein